MVRRWFVRVLVLALVPVVIFAATDAARAASYGPAKSHGWSFDGNGGNEPFGTVACNMVAFWESAEPAVHTRLRCDQEWNEEGPYAMGFTWEGSDDLGNYCEAVTYHGSSDEGVTTNDSGSITTDGEAATCRMSEVCWSYTSFGDSAFDGEEAAEGCFVLDLGAMSVADPTCQYFSVSRPTIAGTHQVDPAGIGGKWVEREVNYEWSVIGVPTGEFRPYAIVRFPGGRVRVIQGSNSPGWETADHDLGGHIYFTGTGQTTTQRRPIVSDTVSDQGGWPAADGVVIGAGYHWLNESNPQGEARTYKFSNAYGDIGLTQGDQCNFYWGEKLTDIPGTDADEPVGGLEDTGGGTPDPPGDEPPPGDVAEGCGGFSISDPSTWASGGICALVELIGALLGLVGDVIGVLGSILAAIGSLVADLLAGLLDLLMALFVPSTSLTAWVADVGSAFDGKAPFGWLEDLAAVPASIPGAAKVAGSEDFAPDTSRAAQSIAVPGGSCPEWEVSIPMTDGSFDQNIVCDSTFTAAVRNLRPVLFAFMALLALWPLIRSTMYGAIPIIQSKAGTLS